MDFSARLLEEGEGCLERLAVVAIRLYGPDLVRRAVWGSEPLSETALSPGPSRSSASEGSVESPMADFGE